MLSSNLPHPAGLDFDGNLKIIGNLAAILQRQFKDEMNYPRPLMPSQGNIIYALDQEVAVRMIDFMSERLAHAGFDKKEFRFTSKSNGEILQRIRLEFTGGVSADIIRKILIVSDQLERVLP